MSEALELLKAAGKHLKANDAPDVVELICSDFAFDDSCPADHAKKCALASFEAGRLAVLEQINNCGIEHYASTGYVIDTDAEIRNFSKASEALAYLDAQAAASDEDGKEETQ